MLVLVVHKGHVQRTARVWFVAPQNCLRCCSPHTVHVQAFTVPLIYSAVPKFATGRPQCKTKTQEKKWCGARGSCMCTTRNGAWPARATFRLPARLQVARWWHCCPGKFPGKAFGASTGASPSLSYPTWDNLLCTEHHVQRWLLQQKAVA